MAKRGPKADLTPEQKAKKTAERKAAKSANFIKLAQKRVTKALKSLEVVGNLGNRNQYDYTDEQVTKIREALVGRLNDTMKRFAPKVAGEETEAGFTL